MRHSGKGSGGGIGNNKVVRRPQGKAEPRPHAKRPAGASQIGTSVGNRATRNDKVLHGNPEAVDGGRGYAAPLGISDPVEAVGVGGGREVHGCGSQGEH